MGNDGENVNKRTVVFPARPKKKKRTGLWIFLGLLAAVFLFALLVGDYENENPYPQTPYVSVMYIEGEIGDSNYDTFGSPYGYQHGWTMDQLAMLADDPDNRGILFYVDSPGGVVYQSDELYLAICEYKEKTGRPVYVYMGPYGTSGAYYASVAADKIYANRNTWTGSIGVTIGTVFDFSRLLNRYGIEPHTVDTGEMKSVGNGWDELTKEQEAYLQGLVDEAYDQFVGVVAQERNMTEERVRELADGRIYTARQAKELGLVDEIGTMEEAEAAMRREYGLEDCAFWDNRYYYSSDLDLMDLLHLFGKSEQKENAAQVQAKAGENMEDPLKYLYTMP